MSEAEVISCPHVPSGFPDMIINAYKNGIPVVLICDTVYESSGITYNIYIGAGMISCSWSLNSIAKIELDSKVVAKIEKGIRDWIIESVKATVDQELGESKVSIEGFDLSGNLELKFTSPTGTKTVFVDYRTVDTTRYKNKDQAHDIVVVILNPYRALFV